MRHACGDVRTRPSIAERFAARVVKKILYAASARIRDQAHGSYDRTSSNPVACQRSACILGIVAEGF
jgi:hypothetical protein